MSNYRFDLEKALAAWRRSLTYNHTFSADDLDELEQHVRDQVEGLVEQGLSEEEAFSQAMQEMGDLGTAEAEYSKVYWGKLKRRRELLHELYWRTAMWKNYLKIAYRTLARQKGYAALNIVGLAIGMACCLLIGLYVRHEWSYDRFHENADRLYRLTYENRMGADLPPAAPEEYQAWGSAAIAPLLEADFPEVEHAVRLSGRHQLLLSRGERKFWEERYFFADSTFFEVFSFPLLRGDPRTALAQPNTIVLAESAAQRYFGDADPMGQTLRLGTAETAPTLTVTGVMADLPANTHLDFDLLLPLRGFEEFARANDLAYMFDDWGYVDFFTYVLLREGASAEAFQAKLPAFVERHYGEAKRERPQSYTLAPEPITAAYLSPSGGFAAGPRGNEAQLYLFSAIGLFILLIACVNFMNLATAYATSRAKEVGVRKTVGARRGGLVSQFLTEAVLLTALAMGVAVALARLALPLLSRLAGKEIPVEALGSLPTLGVLIAGVLIVGLLAGSYPAAVLSAYRPVHVLKGSFVTSGRGAALRKGLVVFQFAAAIVLVVGTLVVREQLHYLQGQALGFDDAQQLVLDFGFDGNVLGDIETFKEELEALPTVGQAAATRSVPGGYVPDATSFIEGPDGTMQNERLALYEVDADFLPQLGVTVAAGRLFSMDRPSDVEEALILNEAATRVLGYADPADVVGQRFEQAGREGEIVGVVEDFNFESLHHEVRPLMVRLSPGLRYLVLQVKAEDAAATVADVRARWSELAPQLPFLFSFLDQSFDAQYRAEDRFGVLFGTFASLAILIACLGLFGLAAYTAEQRTKEIVVRKVLGASVFGLVALLTKDFLKLVALALVVAVPLAWIGITRWLNGFAYRTSPGLDVFLLAGGLALVVALLAVSYHALRKATADPVKSLSRE